MSAAFIIAGARTPIGSFQGSLSRMPAVDLGAVAIKAALERAGCAADRVDEVIMGNVISAGLGQAPARQAALKAGLPYSIPALTINKVCGSGLKAVMLASQAIRCGDAGVIIAGGMENMSRTPHFVDGIRRGQKLGDLKLVDAMVHDGLTCSMEACHMGLHAEHTARKFDVSRADQDAYTLESQQRAAKAIEAGAFVDEIVPVTVRNRRGDVQVTTDECHRPNTTAEGLAELRAVFDESGTVTAGNASTLSDGAAAVVIAGEAAAAELAAPWKARIVASYTSGTEPKDLFVAPVTAVRGALDKAGWSTGDVDYYEINEAFAAQMLACVRLLDLDMSRVNIYGGGISLGHPIGASGARVLVTLMSVLRRNDGRRGVAALCLGGGNAVAMAIERS